MGKGAPAPDKRIGEAAMLSAQTGQDYLAFMKGQSAISNAWAGEDRARYKDVFQPMEDRLVADAQTYDSPEAQATAAREAAADVSISNRMAGDQRVREAMALGVNPASGRFLNAAAKAGQAGSLAEAGAKNMARRTIRMVGDQKRADVVNLGRGMAVNPGTSLSLASGAASSGFSGAMQGYGQQGQLLNQDYQNRMAAWQANQGLMGGLGQAVGTVIGMFSSEELKEDKKPARNLLKAIEKMPVEKWKYKDGVADGGEHIGPYAEDFKKQTGVGDGRTIAFQDALGVTMGAVKEVADKVGKLERRIKMKAAA